MKMLLWLIIAVLYGKIFVCIHRIRVTRKGLSEDSCVSTNNTRTRILLLIPVLREQNVILRTLTHFTNLKTEKSEILVCIAGTSREKLQSQGCETTGEIVSRWIRENSCSCTFRYAEINEEKGDRATQLNYAVRKNEDLTPISLACTMLILFPIPKHLTRFRQSGRRAEAQCFSSQFTL